MTTPILFPWQRRIKLPLLDTKVGNHFVITESLYKNLFLLNVKTKLKTDEAEVKIPAVMS